MTDSAPMSRERIHDALLRFPTRTLGALVFPGFRGLDVWGPLEMFGQAVPAISPMLVGADDQPIASASGPRVIADVTMEQSSRLDLLLIPGGRGIEEKHNAETVEWLRWQASDAEMVMTVSGGAGLLAETGLLDGRRATIDPAMLAAVTADHPRVRWMGRAHLVDDGKVVTSSGISAAIEMSLVVIARLAGHGVAESIAAHTRYHRHQKAGGDLIAYPPNLLSGPMPTGREKLGSESSVSHQSDRQR